MLRRTAFALLSALSLLAAGAQAAKPRLEITPFLGSIARSAWQPFTVTVTNPADASPISGEVRLHLNDPRYGYRNLGNWSRPIQLAPGESKQVTITASVPEGMLPVAEVTLVQGTGQNNHPIAFEKFEGMRVRPGNTIVVLNLSPNPTALSQIDNIETDLGVVGGIVSHSPRAENMGGGYSASAAQAPARFSSRIKVIPLSPADLPADALGLDSITAIYADRATVLTPEQRRLLDSYVGTGGLLVNDSTKGGFLSSMGLGVRAVIRPDNAEDWRIALRARAKRTSLLNGLIHQDPYQSDYYFGLGNAVVAGDSPAPLPLNSLLLFLGAYLIILVPVQYAVLKRLGKREWAWGVTPTLAVLFAMAAYGFGQRGRSRESFVNIASIIELEGGPAAGHGRAITSIGLFSPTHTAYELSVASDGPTRLRGDGNFGDSAESQVNGISTLQNLRVPMWSIKKTQAISEVTLGQGLDISFEGSNTGNWYRVINNTGQTIRSLSIGSSPGIDLESGQTHRFPASNTINSIRYGHISADKTAQQMAERLSAVTSAWRAGASQPVLTGWLDTPPVTLKLDGKTVSPKRQVTLLVVPLTPEPPKHW